MCYKVDCKECGKFSWDGCGRHVPSVYNKIEKGKHCMCKAWPGIEIPSETTTSTVASKAPTASTEDNAEEGEKTEPPGFFSFLKW